MNSKSTKVFVKGLGTDQQDTALVDAIIAMTHALDLSVTAEGGENETQLAHLRSLGCQRGQGFYLARPMPTSAIDELVNTSHQWELV
jgi:EAL domain-containing protein (putative c-di-GMP-specific phosphodiesterase class I)